MSGSSAGSVVSATVGTRATHEVEELLDPESAYYHFWRMLPMRDVVRRRALMDQDQLRKAIAANVRDLSFEQAQTLSRSEEHTSELQSLMRISYAVFCLKNK